MGREKTKARNSGPPIGEAVLCDLTLYVAGTSPRSLQAIKNVKRLCERQFPGRYKLRIIDIYQQPHEAREAQIVVVPTLIRNRPTPRRLFIGDMAVETDIAGGTGGSQAEVIG